MIFCERAIVTLSMSFGSSFWGPILGWRRGGFLHLSPIFILFSHSWWVRLVFAWKLWEISIFYPLFLPILFLFSSCGVPKNELPPRQQQTRFPFPQVHFPWDPPLPLSFCLFSSCSSYWTPKSSKLPIRGPDTCLQRVRYPNWAECQPEPSWWLYNQKDTLGVNDDSWFFKIDFGLMFALGNGKDFAEIGRFELFDVAVVRLFFMCGDVGVDFAKSLT